MIFRKFALILFLSVTCGLAFAEGEKGGNEFDASETILNHVLDSHDWHLLDIPGKDASGNKVYHPVALHLPWLFYSSKHGIQFYANTDALNAGGLFYADAHEGSLYTLKDGASSGHGPELEEPHGEEGHGDEGHTDEGGEQLHADEGGHGHFDAAALADTEASILDFSPTKTVVQMIIILFIVFFVFLAVARGYARNRGKAPTGMQSFFEPIILFVRDDIAREYLADKYLKYTPYLLTLFFFIWFSNLFGLTPLNSNIMGNISVTAALAVLTFILVQSNGSKDYWKHIVWFPGVAVPMKLLMFVIETISLFVKPFALAIRLFANISAGHFMVLSLICMIFIMGKGGETLGGAIGIAPLSIAFTLFIFTLEMIVAIIQAYIFTLLTAVFIGMARETHSDH
jgi:F-type H+-transporting ATPase subunit a